MAIGKAKYKQYLPMAIKWLLMTKQNTIFMCVMIRSANQAVDFANRKSSRILRSCSLLQKKVVAIVLPAPLSRRVLYSSDSSLVCFSSDESTNHSIKGL